MAGLLGLPPPRLGHLWFAPRIHPSFLLETDLQTPLGTTSPISQPMIGALILHPPSRADHLIGHPAYPLLLAVAIGSEMVS